jgi:amidase
MVRLCHFESLVLEIVLHLFVAFAALHAMARFWHIVSYVATAWLSFAPLLVGANTVKGKSFPTLIEATIDDLNSGLSSGLFTSVDLVNAYTARIKEVNGTLHMVTELNPDALTIAATADALRKNGTILGPLHGIPIIVRAQG